MHAINMIRNRQISCVFLYIYRYRIVTITTNVLCIYIYKYTVVPMIKNIKRVLCMALI